MWGQKRISQSYQSGPPFGPWSWRTLAKDKNVQEARANSNVTRSASSGNGTDMPSDISDLKSSDLIQTLSAVIDIDKMFVDFQSEQPNQQQVGARFLRPSLMRFNLMPIAKMFLHLEKNSCPVWWWSGTLMWWDKAVFVVDSDGWYCVTFFFWLFVHPTTLQNW